MPTDTPIERRNRAIVAFAILTGARDGALASFRLKHIDLSAQTLFQDAREVRTKGRKTFTSIFFPVGPEPREIVADYVVMLKDELGFSADDPLFPSTQMGRGEDRGFVAEGLSRIPWSGAAPIRRIFRDAFEAAALPYANPHSFRDTLVRLGQRICRTPEEWKVWSQNLGHENEATTFVGYGQVPAHRHAEIMRGIQRSPPRFSASWIGHRGPEGLCSERRGDKCLLIRLLTVERRRASRTSTSVVRNRLRALRSGWKLSP